MLIKINDYLGPKKIPKKLFEGRYPPNIPKQSPILKEWYEEVAEYAVNGITIRGQFYNPLLYHWLNLFSFPAIKIDDKGKVVSVNDIGFPLYSTIDHYIFDNIWDAMLDQKHISFMSGRGIGKTFIALSILTRSYTFFPGAHNIISSSGKTLANTDWSYTKNILNNIYKTHPEFYQATLKNNDEEIKSGYKFITDNGIVEKGNLSSFEKIIYSDPNATRSKRPDKQLIEEFGTFPSKGKKSLKNILNQSKGSWIVGGNYVKTMVLLLGTGGSIENEQAQDVYENPEAYNIKVVTDWGKKTGIFIPVHYKMTGTWEKNGNPDIEKAEELEDIIRAKLKETGDDEAYRSHLQEFPKNLEEVFLRKGSNNFNQDKIVTAIYKITSKNEEVPEIKTGMFRWIKDSSTGNAVGVEFIEGVGNVHIIKEPDKDKEKKLYKNLYVLGVDSIDQGKLDTTERESRQSKLVCLVKKRINKYFSGEHSFYVAWYEGRSNNVKDDYEQVIMMSLYYGGKINLEYAKIGIKIYFETKNMEHLFMKRPRASLTGTSKNTNLIGTTTTKEVIKHQDNLIAEYINDYYQQIYILPLLEQLRDYDQENRREFDFVVAMGMCELADEDYFDRKVENRDDFASKEMVMWGYYRDSNGKKRYGAMPAKADMGGNNYQGAIQWYDKDGTPRFDSDYLDEQKESSEEDTELF